MPKNQGGVVFLYLCVSMIRADQQAAGKSPRLNTVHVQREYQASMVLTSLFFVKSSADSRGKHGSCTEFGASLKEATVAVILTDLLLSATAKLGSLGRRRRSFAGIIRQFVGNVTAFENVPHFFVLGLQIARETFLRFDFRGQALGDFDARRLQRG